MNKRLTPLPAILAALLLAGCAVGPDYHQPESPLPGQFVGASPEAAALQPVADFWSSFNDPVLNDLIRQALAANHDLRIAAARLREARALRRDAAFDFLPTVSASASRTSQRLSFDQRPDLTRRERDSNAWDAGFDASWELDLFGRTRRGFMASRGEALAAKAALDASFVTVTSEVARSYFELRGFQERYAVARRNAVNQQDTLQLTQTRLDAGRGTELDVARAQAQYSTTQASLPALETAIARAQYRLGVLTGQSPTALLYQLGTAAPLPFLPEIVPVGNPADWLRRRPDIRIAEGQLIAATGRVGIAVADLFPRVTLVGHFGWNAIQRDELGSRDSENYSLGPTISWAILDLGHVQARLAAARASNDAALAQYQLTVLTALEDAEGSLLAYSRAQVRTAALDDAAKASATATRLARRRYEAGLSDFLAVLDAERTQLDAEDRLAQAQSETATALVAVYKALGAGWDGVDSPYRAAAQR